MLTVRTHYKFMQYLFTYQSTYSCYYYENFAVNSLSTITFFKNLNQKQKKTVYNPFNTFVSKMGQIEMTR